jgi:hypothetical protein
MLVDTINEYQFSDEMIKHGFSYEGEQEPCLNTL